MTKQEAKALAVRLGCGTVREARGKLLASRDLCMAVHKHFDSGPGEDWPLSDMAQGFSGHLQSLRDDLSKHAEGHKAEEQERGSMTYDMAMQWKSSVLGESWEEDPGASTRRLHDIAAALERGPEDEKGGES